MRLRRTGVRRREVRAHSTVARSRGTTTELWRGLRYGALDVIATDHCPFCLKEQKELGRDDFSKIPNGGPGIENRMSLIYHHGVGEGHINLNRFVELTSTAAAKIFGLFPKKGTIAVGSDADIVIFDPEREETISVHNPRTHHMNVDYSTYEGFKVKGLTETVLSRGKVVVDRGEYVGRAGDGAFVRTESVRRGARMSGNGSGGGRTDETPLYTIEWPRADAHETKSVSGVLVERNVHSQVALHFYNEVRELEPSIRYMEDGSRADPSRALTYVREITDSILLSGATARPASRPPGRAPVRSAGGADVGHLNRRVHAAAAAPLKPPGPPDG